MKNCTRLRPSALAWYIADVCPLKYVVLRGDFFGEHQHANADTAMVFHPRVGAALLTHHQQLRLGQAQANFFCNGRSLRGGHRLVDTELAKRDHKLITPEAPHRVHLTHIVGRAPCHFHQQ